MRGLSPRAALASIVSLLLLAGGSPAGAQMMGGNTYSYIAFDELELATTPEARPLVFDGEGWIGGDIHRLWLKAAGDQGTRAGFREGDFALQALYSRATTPFWNLQTGLRVDHSTEDSGETRPRLALGVEGLAPYWFEVEAFLFVGQDGDVSASLEASYDLLLTQRLILEPEFEIGVGSRAIPAFGLGSGLTEGEAGLRIRYEFRREFAPYVGYSWERRFGDTAELARAAGGEVREGSWVAGVRWWY